MNKEAELIIKKDFGSDDVYHIYTFYDGDYVELYSGDNCLGTFRKNEFILFTNWLDNFKKEMEV